LKSAIILISLVILTDASYDKSSHISPTNAEIQEYFTACYKDDRRSNDHLLQDLGLPETDNMKDILHMTKCFRDLVEKESACVNLNSMDPAEPFSHVLKQACKVFRKTKRNRRALFPSEEAIDNFTNSVDEFRGTADVAALFFALSSLWTFLLTASGACRGPVGPTGPTGADGSTGLVGATGSTGTSTASICRVFQNNCSPIAGTAGYFACTGCRIR